MSLSTLMAAAGAVALLAAQPLAAETLQGALVKAYATNPTLNAARSGQKAADENIAIARARGLPSVAANANYTQTFQSQIDSLGSPSRLLTVGPTLSVPLYAGGATKNGIRAADVRSAQGRAQLRGTELSVFSQVVAAYMDVILNENLVALNAQQVNVLDVNLQATKDRFQIGDLTRRSDDLRSEEPPQGRDVVNRVVNPAAARRLRLVKPPGVPFFAWPGLAWNDRPHGRVRGDRLTNSTFVDPLLDLQVGWRHQVYVLIRDELHLRGRREGPRNRHRRVAGCRHLDPDRTDQDRPDH